MKNAPLSRKTDVVVQESGKETLVYDLKTNKAFCLNETSSAVWRLCDGSRTTADISAEMAKIFNNPISENFVRFALDQLNRDHLLEGKVGAHFAEVSRRALIRKIGFTSLVALPTISSLVAPRAMMAQSAGGGALLSSCTPGPNACDPGLICRPTLHSTDTGANGGTPTGNDQCCAQFSSGFDPTSTFCSFPACNTGPGGFTCCSNTATSAPPIPGCSFNSCVCA